MNITRLIVSFVTLLFIVTIISPDDCEALLDRKKQKSPKRETKIALKKSPKKLSTHSSKSSSKHAPKEPTKPGKIMQIGKRAGTKIGLSLASRTKPYVNEYVDKAMDKACKNKTWTAKLQPLMHH